MIIIIMETQTINNLSKEVMILKKELSEIRELLKEDLVFAKRTEEAWQEIDEGKCTRMNSEDFLTEIKKW